MFAEEFENHWTQIALLWLQMKSVWSARHDNELVFDAYFLERRVHNLRIAELDRRVCRAVHNQYGRIAFIEMRQWRDLLAQLWRRLAILTDEGFAPTRRVSDRSVEIDHRLDCARLLCVRLRWVQPRLFIGDANHQRQMTAG